jgi:hypothetical protein
MITRAPEKRPEAPAPATERPIMRTMELWESAHIRDPSLKVRRNERYEYLSERF